ncbi:hypothetical protein RQP46_005993 [Phenoliferia psychrophenolica]
MPNIPDPVTFRHSDPVLRRLRLRDSWGKPVDLKAEFRDAVVVVFFFGASWPGSSDIPSKAVEDFAKRHPHRLKVVYCSCDTSEKAYEGNTRGKIWTAMDEDSQSTLPPPPPPSEPFLLASDPDLESDLVDPTSDPTGNLYLRPYSRVFLAEKFQVLGVPNLVVYHLPTGKVLSKHARFESLKGDKGEEVWKKWEEGEGGEFSFKDIVDKMKWTLGMGVVAAAYVVAVRVGGVEDVLGKLTETLTKNYLAGGR